MRKKTNKTAIIVTAIALVAIAVIFILLLPKNGEYVPGPAGPVRVHVLHDEVRGVYVPSGYNISFPSRADLPAKELEAELDAIVERCAASGLNTVCLQVRPECDALYESDIFPVCRWLSSDRVLTLDCLAYLVEAAHAKDISVFAWVNPLRVTAGKAEISDLPDTSPAKGAYSDCVVSYGGKLYLDPARPESRELVVRGVSEIVSKYEVDGIIFDDYFYPYKVYENDVLAVFDDKESFAKYGADYENIGDFRRECVNELIREVYAAVKDADPVCLFGVAPFGIWRNAAGGNGGSATRGLESYYDIYCDSLAWCREGTVDFIAPQIYWSRASSVASFSVLFDWWSEALKDSDVRLWISHAAYLADDGTFPPGELHEQIKIAEASERCSGSVFYSYTSIQNEEVMKEIRR